MKWKVVEPADVAGLEVSAETYLGARNAVRKAVAKRSAADRLRIMNEVVVHRAITEDFVAPPRRIEANAGQDGYQRFGVKHREGASYETTYSRRFHKMMIVMDLTVAEVAKRLRISEADVRGLINGTHKCGDWNDAMDALRGRFPW